MSSTSEAERERERKRNRIVEDLRAHEVLNLESSSGSSSSSDCVRNYGSPIHTQSGDSALLQKIIDSLGEMEARLEARLNAIETAVSDIRDYEEAAVRAAAAAAAPRGELSAVDQ